MSLFIIGPRSAANKYFYVVFIEMAGAAAIIKLVSLTSGAPFEFRIERRLSGGTGPLLVRRASDGRQFVLKAAIYESGRELIQRNAHEANEYLAFQLYKAAGVRIPDGIDLVKVDIEGKKGEDVIIGVLEDFIDGVTLNDLMNPSRADPHVRVLTFPAIRNDLVIHALFANWDINMTDNIMIARITAANGSTTFDYSNPITIDCAGTLLFRAMGELKDYGPVVRNVESIVGYAANYKPMGALKGLSKDELKAEICRRWATVNKGAIMDAFAATAGLVADYFAATGLSIDRLGETLAARMAHFDALCAGSAPASAASAAAQAPVPAPAAASAAAQAPVPAPAAASAAVQAPAPAPAPAPAAIQARAPAPAGGVGAPAPAAAAFETMTPNQRGIALIQASEDGDFETVNLLLSMGTDVNFMSAYDETPLLAAIQEEHIDMAKRLLSAGANPNISFQDGQTVLHAAAEADDLIGVNLLLEAGANKDAVDKARQTPLHIAAQEGNAAVVKSLLIAGANREAKDQHGQTPLFYAVTEGHIEVIKHLLGAGADMNARNNRGKTLTSIIPNEEVRNIFNIYDNDHISYDSINVGDKILVNAKHTISSKIQKVAATVVEVTPSTYVVDRPMKTLDILSFGLYNANNSKNLLELFHFVFPQLFPEKEPIGNLSDTNPYKTNNRLIELLRLLNNPDDSLDERNKVFDEIIAMNISSINRIIGVARNKIITSEQGIKVEFEYSPGVFAYYTYSYSKLFGIFDNEYEKQLLPKITTKGIVSSNIMKYSIEQTLAIRRWISDNKLAYYLALPGIYKSTITNPFIGNERLWRSVENMFEHEYDILYDAASPTPIERILYRGEDRWPSVSSRRRTIFATSTKRHLAEGFGDVRMIKIPVGTRILDLSEDFNRLEAEVLVFPSVRKTNLVIEPLLTAPGNLKTVIIRNVEERNRNLPRSRRRSRRSNNQNKRRSTRRR